jgi:hypothetical protein
MMIDQDTSRGSDQPLIVAKKQVANSLLGSLAMSDTTIQINGNQSRGLEYSGFSRGRNAA